MVGATLRKTLDLQCKNRAMTHVFRKIKSSRQHACFVACQIAVLNKQLVSPLSWNNPLAETSLGESYVLTIYRHLDAKEKHFLDVEGVYNILFYVEYCLEHLRKTNSWNIYPHLL